MAAMSRDSHSRASPQRPKRLPGLWVICVLFGLAGAFHLCLALLATPLGLVFFAGIALVYFAAAIGLWLRSNVVRIVVMALVGLLCARLLVRLALRYEQNAWMAIPFCAGLGVLAYLWLRREHFKVPRGQKPGLASVSTGLAGGLVLLLGVPYILLTVVDDPPRSFPGLAVDSAPVADEDNAFLVLQDMIERFPAVGGDDVWRLDGSLPDQEPLDGQQWVLEARRAIRKRRQCLAMVDEMLARPGFAVPVPATYWQRANEPREWLGYSHKLAWLLALKSDLHLAEGRPVEAINTAQQITRLGILLCEHNESLITCLVGDAIVAIGLEQLRGVAMADTADAGLLLPVIQALEMRDPLRRGIKRAMGHEFAVSQMILRGFRTGELWSSLPDGAQVTDVPWDTRLPRDPLLPWLKVNMSRNVLGDFLAALVEKTQRYQPPPTERRTGPFGVDCLTEDMNLLHFLRNPLGDVLISLLGPALERTVVEYFRAVADARLTQVFLALRCYHLEEGRLPDSLDELAPRYFEQLPVDPFTEEPFAYEPHDDPPRIYSVGRDQKPDQPDAEEQDDFVAELTFVDPHR